MALPTASDNPFPSVLVTETAAASISSPAAGKQRLFVDTDHVLKYKNSSGTVSAVGSASAAIGASALVYRYTVVGADKAAIDTGVDTPDAGSNDWTNGDMLEVFMYLRTDEATVDSGCSMIVNNDSAAHYDRHYGIIGSSLLAGDTNAASVCSFGAAGASAGANYFSTECVRVANYAGTVGYKTIELFEAETNSAAGVVGLNAYAFRSTSAITRLAISVATAGKKFKIGSQMLVYKRLAS